MSMSLHLMTDQQTNVHLLLYQERNEEALGTVKANLSKQASSSLACTR